MSMFPISCTPQESITAESARNDTIKLLNDLKMDYKGVHCSLRNSAWDATRFADCEISTKDEILKVKCELHECRLIEKGALRIKFGITK